jgi:class 3 adenylate cyclase/tetratricopeptide (TPR) repeat protein
VTDARIVTILFTDLVGSTQLSGRLGDVEADKLRRAHYGLLRDAVTAHRGAEVKSLGDGLMVVFGSAVDAAACAADMQRAVDRHNRRPVSSHMLEVRIGLHAGEPVREGEDYHGVAVNIAKRLCDVAEGGQILASELVRGLAAGHDEIQFRPIGPVELKGINEPVATAEVLWSSAATSPVPPPPFVTSATRFPFIGRDAQRDEVWQQWKAAAAGERRTVLLAGEPGIGKTRLARELAAAAAEQGAIVLFGRCDEDPPYPYQPLVEALRFYAANVAADDLKAQTAGSASDLARLVPEVAERLEGDETNITPDPDTERFRLFRAVARLIDEAAKSAPMLLVLDDLHWADRPTLALLKHILRDPEPAALLVLGTYRDTDLDRKHPLAETLTDLRREQLYTRVQLKGMSEPEVVSFLEGIARQDLGAAGVQLANTLYGETDGNPFFIEEILLNLVETGRIYHDGTQWQTQATADLDIPEGVREAVGRRLARLSSGANDALAQAAVLGPRFEYETLRTMGSFDREVLTGALEEARDIQMLLETELDDRPAFTFAHALVRQVLYEELSLPRRQQYHLRAAEAIEAMPTAVRSIAALAAHYRAAGAAADHQKAIDYSLLAGRAATEVFAYEESAGHLQGALELIDLHGGDPHLRAQLVGFLGDLMYITGLDMDRGITWLEEALAIYEELGDEHHAAQMHSRLGRSLSSSPETMDIAAARRHYEAALAVLDQGPPRPSLAYAFTGLAGTHLWGVDTPSGFAASARGLEIAEQLDNEPLWAFAAAIRCWFLWASGRITEARQLVRTAYEVADRTDNGAASFFASWMGGCIEDFSGNPGAGIGWFERELALARQAEAPGQRRLLTLSLAQASSGAGDLERVRALVDEQRGDSADGLATTVARELALWAGEWAAAQMPTEADDDNRRAGNRFAMAGSFGRRSLIARVRGDHATATGHQLAALEICEDQGPAFESSARGTLAIIYTHLSRLDAATREIDRARPLLPEDEGWEAARGALAMAEATVDAASGRHLDAERRFAEAHRVVTEVRNAVVEVECLMEWGRARIGAGDIAGGNERLDVAAETLVRIGAGDPWFECIDRLRP